MKTFVHPSRQRPHKALSTYKSWMDKAVDKNIQHILSLDIDDETLSQYQTNFPDSKILIHSNGNLIQAVNRALPFISGDLVVVLSDDFDCPERWDEQITITALDVIGVNDKVMTEGQPKFFIEENNSKLISEGFYAIYVNDGISFGRKCMTLPILSKRLVYKLGYIYHPQYTGMFADDDLYLTCEKLGVIITKNILFQHKHWVNGMAAKDETYLRHNTTESWNKGKALLELRKRRGFAV